MKKYTTAGTDIESVKQQNANSGMSYNEVKALLARTTGGHGTARFSNTDVEQVKRNNSPDSQGED
ncbi:gamma-type small acid-soluble spore protein [Mesobacillus foraminis]|uniref:gamma-type small acid-soluble spore protein n=1 Tax=Mesobacillus foraminis TaxID=279826 RepID=UPI0039A145E7